MGVKKIPVIGKLLLLCVFIFFFITSCMIFLQMILHDRYMRISECFVVEEGLKVIVHTKNVRVYPDDHFTFADITYYYEDDNRLWYYRYDFKDGKIVEYTDSSFTYIFYGEHPEGSRMYDWMRERLKIYTNRKAVLSAQFCPDWVWAEIYINDPFGEDGSCYEFPFTMYNDFKVDVLSSKSAMHP